MSEAQDPKLDALTQIISALGKVKPDERRGLVESAMTYYGEPNKPLEDTSSGPAKPRDDAGPFSPEGKRWMQKNNVTSEQLEHAFHFHDGTFDILDVPGKSKKERTKQVYVLAGVGQLLTTGKRTIDDESARGICDHLSCYDYGNHAATLKEARAEITGDKSRGFSITVPGEKHGAALVKELAGDEE